MQHGSTYPYRIAGPVSTQLTPNHSEHGGHVA